MNVDDQLNEQDQLLLEKVETILAGEADSHLVEDSLYELCAQMANTIPRVSSDFKERLWGRLVQNNEQLAVNRQGELNYKFLASPPQKEYRALPAERLDNWLHTAWGWLLPAGAVILIILVVSLLLQMRPRQGGPTGEVTATAPTPTPRTPASSPQTHQSFDGAAYYIVQEGDTLTSIASQFGVTVEALLEANRLESLGIPYVGMTLLIPPSTTYPGPNETIYVVRVGDTLSSIAHHFDVTVEALLEANNLEARGVPYAGMTLFIPVIYPGPRDSTYTVQEGDTLTSIASHYDVAVDALLEANRLKIGGLPYTGETLVIPTTGMYPGPKDSIYVIQEGDSLTGIARRFGMTVNDLLGANYLTNEVSIHVGEMLFIPRAPDSQPSGTPDPAAQAILDQLHGLVARRRAELLTGQGWIYVHLRSSDTAYCQTGAMVDYSRPCQYDEHYWFELNARNEVVSTIYRQLDLSGQALEEWVRRDGLYRNFTRGFANTVTLTSTYETDWGFTAQAEASSSRIRESSSPVSEEYQGMLSLQLSQAYDTREAVFDPQTGALLSLTTSSSHADSIKVLAEERVEAPPADALALFDRPLTSYQPRPPQGDPVPAGFDLAHSRLQFKTIGGDHFDSPSFWYADIYADGAYLVGRVDFGAVPGGFCQRSPDGLKLAFNHVTQAESNSVQQLRWLDLTSPDDVHIVQPELYLSSPPAWDPGSTRLAFTACDGSQYCRLYTYDIASGELQSLVDGDSPIARAAPIWSPDGAEIAYWTGAGESPQLVVVDTASGMVITSPGWQPQFQNWVGFSQCEIPPALVPTQPAVPTDDIGTPR